MSKTQKREVFCSSNTERAGRSGYDRAGGRGPFDVEARGGNYLSET